MENHHLFFPLKEGEDPEEVYESLLFEDKKFFTQKPVHPKLFKGKLQKLMLREEAYSHLTGEKYEHPVFDLEELRIGKKSTVVEYYTAYLDLRRSLFQRIYSAQNIKELIFYVEFLLAEFKVYCHQFDVAFLNNLALEVPQSKELDAMRLDGLMKEFDASGGVSPEDIEHMNFQGQDELLKEFKRLSLLSQIQ